MINGPSEADASHATFARSLSFACHVDDGPGATMLGRLRALVCAPAGPARAPGPLLQQLRGMAKYAANTMKRRYRGLYDGKHIKFGNTISFSHKKCARSPREMCEVRLTHGARAGHGVRGSPTCSASASGRRRTVNSCSSG